MKNTPNNLTGSGLPYALFMSLTAAAALAALGHLIMAGPRSAGLRTAMWAAIAVALVGSWGGSIAPLVCLKRTAAQFVAGFLLGLAARFGLTLLLTLLVLRLLPALSWNGLLLWVGIAQTVLLGVDTVVLLRLCAARSEATR